MRVLITKLTIKSQNLIKYRFMQSTLILFVILNISICRRINIDELSKPRFYIYGTNRSNTVLFPYDIDQVMNLMISVRSPYVVLET